MGWFDEMRARVPRPGAPTFTAPPGPIVAPNDPTSVIGAGGAVTQPPPVTPPPTAMPGALEGWDPTKWANQSHQSHKYKVGRILAKYPPTVAGLKQALPELQAAYPGAKILGLGDLDLGLGEDPVDVLRSASTGGTGWQWLTTDEARAGRAMGNPGVQPIAPNLGVGGGGVPGAGGGGADAGGGGWTMPRGSDYQFGGVPGYTSGRPAGGAFALPAQPGTGTGLPGGAGQPSSNPNGGMQLFGGGSAGNTGGSTTLPGVGSAGVGPAGSPPVGGGAFGTGQTTTSAGGRQLFGTSGGDAPRPASGGYDRAPGFTPIDPFRAPDAPEAYSPWQGTAFDVGTGPERFTLPTGQAALEQDPGYQFRLEQGGKALEQSAAARGLLRTGGTLKDIQDFGQRAASQEYQSAVDRALAVAGFNESNRRGQADLGLRANDQDNRYGLAGSQFNADQIDRRYQNRYTAANQGYAYANQQNLAGNAQAMTGYQTDVGRDLGIRGLNLTAAQNAAVNALNGQQQQWMQIYMQNGQSFDQAYRLMMAKLQYPA